MSRSAYRAISDCHLAVQPSHFIYQVLLSYSVAVFSRVTIGYHPYVRLRGAVGLLLRAVVARRQPRVDVPGLPAVEDAVVVEGPGEEQGLG